tara:strand:- start:347 stop:550 length:204 start_codon:yes stop_codon:yes gene_type:complete
MAGPAINGIWRVGFGDTILLLGAGMEHRCRIQSFANKELIESIPWDWNNRSLSRFLLTLYEKSGAED